MDDLKDRRYMDRITIPKAQLFYRVNDKHKLLHAYHGPFWISDICKSSLSISGALRFKNKTPLCLKLIVPDQPEILLKGFILGYLRNRAGQVIKTVIQLMPFGHAPQYNTFKQKRRLENCLSRCAAV